MLPASALGIASAAAVGNFLLGDRLMFGEPHRAGVAVVCQGGRSRGELPIWVGASLEPFQQRQRCGALDSDLPQQGTEGQERQADHAEVGPFHPLDQRSA